MLDKYAWIDDNPYCPACQHQQADMRPSIWRSDGGIDRPFICDVCEHYWTVTIVSPGNW